MATQSDATAKNQGQAVEVKQPGTSPATTPATTDMSRDEFGQWMERMFDWPERFGPSMFDRFFRDFPSRLWPERWMPAFESAEQMLRVEEEFTDHELVIRAEIPGIDPDKDVSIHLVNGRLEINAERRSEKKEEGKGRYRSEFRYGSFHRSLPMPPSAKPEDVKAIYRDGVLEVHVPVETPSAEKTKVAVKRS